MQVHQGRKRRGGKRIKGIHATSICVVLPDLELDGDDHRGEILVQLLQHDQLLQGQVEQPGEKQRESGLTSAGDATVQRSHYTPDTRQRNAARFFLSFPSQAR